MVATSTRVGVMAAVVLATVALSQAGPYKGGDGGEKLYNKNIDWKLARSDLDNIMKNGSDKPTLVLISKSWCGACKNLKQAFNSASGETREVEDLAKKFNMINLVDNEEPQDTQFAPDGGYIPRILYLNKEGKVLPDLKNPQGNPKYKYFYSHLTQVKAGMRAALRKLAPGEL